MSNGEGVRRSGGRGVRPDAAVDDTSPTSPRLDGDVLVYSTDPPAFTPEAVVADRFRIVRLIGRGGVGEVYEAEDLQLQERVAVKTIRTEALREEAVVERFRREIQLARRVTHVNVCRLFEFALHHVPGATVSLPLLSMELLDGETLTQRLHRTGALDVDEAKPIALQIAAGLAAAHAAGIIHRDLKSSNVMLVPAGADGTRAVVTDFGLARAVNVDNGLTAARTVMGTPAYMAPEQVSGGEVTKATDVYALGLVLYEMITDALPFEADTSIAAAVKRLREDPVPPRTHVPDLDERWQRVILRCLERDPARRFASVADVAQALAGETPVPPPAPSRSPSRGAAFALAAALGLGAAGLVGIQLLRTAAPPASAVRARRAVAVLGFKNLGGQAETAWLSTAFAEMLGAELASTRQLRTIPGENIARMKADLDLTESDSYARETLARIRAHLGTDVVVVGSYLALGDSAAGQIRLDVRVQDAAEGETVGLISETRKQSELFDLVGRIGARLREELHVGPTTAEQAAWAAASRPASSEAARFYAEGLAALRAFDVRAARNKLEQAVAADPSYPSAHSALSLAWREIGDDERARQAAARGVELSAGLAREERVLIEARYADIADPGQAVELYERLWRLAPDEVEYGLRLGEAQLRVGKPEAALTTAAGLRSLAAPARDDARVALLAARAHIEKTDYATARDLAAEARKRAEAQGSRFVAARAAAEEGLALGFLGDKEGAERAEAYAASVYSEAGDRVRLADLLLRQVTSPGLNWELARVERLAGELLGIYREIGNSSGEMRARKRLSRNYRRQGKLALARQWEEEANALAAVPADAASPVMKLQRVWFLAWVDYERGAIDQAKAAFERSAAELGQARLPAGEELLPYAIVLRERGELARAKALIETVAEAFEARQVDHSHSVWARHLLGRVLHVQGDLDGARREYEEAAAVRGRVQSAGGAGGSADLAALLLDQTHVVEAEAMARRVAEFFRSAGAPDYELEALAVWTRILLAQGRREEARPVVARLRDLAETSENVPVRLSARLVLASAQAAEAAHPEALRTAGAVLAEAAERGYRATWLEARLVQAEIAAAAGRPAEAQPRLSALAAEAERQGFGLLARRARSAVGFDFAERGR